MTTPQTTQDKALAFIRERLLEDAVIAEQVGERIYSHAAQSSTVYPCIVMAYYDGTSQEAGDGQAWYLDSEWLVKAIERYPITSARTVGLDELAARIKAQLQNYVSGDVFVCHQVRPHDMQSAVGTQTYRERGGIFSIAIKEG
jgi:hypothetical protein